MYQFLLISIVVISCLLIFLILMQQGKGADAGAAFGGGGGASGSVFGAHGAGTFLSRMTAILATLFFIVCLALAWLIANQNAGNLEEESVIDRAIQEGVIQDLPGAANTVAPGVDLPDAGVTLDTGDLPAAGDGAASVSVEATAGESISVDMPVEAPEIGSVDMDAAVDSQVDAATEAASGAIESVTDQAQELIIQPEIELPDLPEVE